MDYVSMVVDGVTFYLEFKEIDRRSDGNISLCLSCICPGVVGDDACDTCGYRYNKLIGYYNKPSPEKDEIRSVIIELLEKGIDHSGS